MRLKDFARDFFPPILLRAYRRLRPSGISLSGPYDSWQEALSHSSGYAGDLIVDKVKNALLKVKNGEAACERDSVTFDTKQYSFPVLAGLLRAVINANGPLKVLDYGGSLGSSYFLYRDLLEPVKTLSWHVVEQPGFVDCGRRDFENGELRFFASVDDSLATGAPDVVLFSSVLQYVEHPDQVVNRITSYNPPYIIIDRTPFRDAATDLITVQTVPPEIYEASYPSWVFGEALVGNMIANGYRLLAKWDTDENDVEVSGTTAHFRGLLLENSEGRS